VGSRSSDLRDEEFASFGFNVFGKSAQTICVFDFRELTRGNILANRQIREHGTNPEIK
jgi:hypothetical protein